MQSVSIRMPIFLSIFVYFIILFDNLAAAVTESFPQVE